MRKIKAILIGNGNIRNYSFIKKFIANASYIVCCDGGLRHAETLAVTPNLIIGDFDSACPKTIEKYKEIGVEFKEFPSNKDYSDMELGLLNVIEKEATEVIIIGGIGTRFDHTLSNAHILTNALRERIRATLVDENNIIQLIDKHTTTYGKKGDYISLIPLTTEVTGVYTSGLQYKLSNETIKIGSSKFISNVFCGHEAEIKIETGLLFVIQAFD